MDNIPILIGDAPDSSVTGVAVQFLETREEAEEFLAPTDAPSSAYRDPTDEEFERALELQEKRKHVMYNRCKKRAKRKAKAKSAKKSRGKRKK